jgi:hypothetical protein
MNADAYTFAQLQHLIEAAQKQYQKAIEIDQNFEKARSIFLKIKELKKTSDAKKISRELSQYHS